MNMISVSTASRGRQGERPMTIPRTTMLFVLLSTVFFCRYRQNGFSNPFPKAINDPKRMIKIPAKPHRTFPQS